MKVEQAPHNPKAYGNPFFGGIMGTGASRTTQSYYPILRLAGMQARAIMIGCSPRGSSMPVTSLW